MARVGAALIEGLRTWLVWAVLEVLSPGWAAWLLTRDQVAVYLGENLLASGSPLDASPFLISSAALMSTVFALRVRSARRRDPQLCVHDAMRQVTRAWRPILALPVLPLLFTLPAGIQSFLRPTLIAMVTILIASGVLAWPWPVPKLSRRLARDLSFGTVAVATVAWVVFFARLGWKRHWSLNTRAFDLGIYDNIFWNTLHGDPLACSIIKGGTHTSAHFDPILVLLTPLYGLAPKAETLISLQVVWIATGVVPLYRLCMKRLGSRGFATVLCLCYLLYPSLQGIVLFDFHSLALLIPLALWAIERLEAGGLRGYFAALAGILLVREDAALFACGLGLYAMVRTPSRMRVGVATLAMSIAWLTTVKLFVMPDSGLLMASSEATYTYANRYGDVIPGGEGGVRDIAATVVTNPMFVLQYVLQADKIVMLLVLLLPLCFLPLLSGPMWVTFAYGLAFTLLASKPSLYYPYFHYVSVLVPVLFAAAPAGFERLLQITRADGPGSPVGRATMAALLSSSLLCALAYGAVVENETFRLHTDIVRELSPAEREQIEWVRKTAASIPADASVSASNRLAPHVTNRAKVHIIQQEVDTDYVLLHKGDLSSEELETIRRKVTRGTHTIVDTQGLMMLLERG